MVRRGEITDEAWARIEPLLPEYGRRGGRWREHRTVIDGILWKLRTGAPWTDLPERYGPWQTCYDRFVRWRRDGTWERLLARAQTKSDAVGEVEWEVSVDSTVVRAHQHAAGAPEAGPRGRKRGLLNPAEEALGRGRGGFSTKVHLACDGRGRPLSVVVTAGQRNEAPQLEALLDGIRVARPGRGRPPKRPERLLAERGYAHDSCRRLLRRRGVPHTIPERKDQKERRRRRGGRPPSFDAEAYRRRNVVERCVGRLKQWRSVATRYEKRAANYRAMVVIASLMIWLTT